MLEDLEWKHVLIGIFVLVVIVLVAAIIPALYVSLNPNIGRAAIIKLDGEITDNGGQSGFTPENVASLTKKATNQGADVIIYEINSPGGAVVASKESSRIVKDTTVPTICLMKDVAASGAYWMSSACDKIVADSLTLTGSIGVTSAYLQFSGLLHKMGITYVNLTAGKYKDMGSRWTNLTGAERTKFDNILNTVHASFIKNVADNRNMSVEQVRNLATGEVFVGSDAKKLGLVDVLGGKKEALDLAKNMTGVSELRTTDYSPPHTLNLASLLFSSIGEGIAKGLKGQQQASIRAQYGQ